MRIKEHLNTILICLTVLIVGLTAAWAFSGRYRVGDTINVTGMGSEDFASDLIVWRGSFSRINPSLKTAYEALNRDRAAIRNYLLKQGMDEKGIIFSSVSINKEYRNVQNSAGGMTQEFSGYRLDQSVQIESSEIDLVEGLSRQITELINVGIEFNSERPEYYYTKLSELKIRMIASATQDGRARAAAIARNSRVGLGKLRSANLGVFQITARNSSEDYSWGGTFNTSSRLKTATITMKLQYKIK